MATTVNDLRQWFDDGVRQNATHMIIKCDMMDYEDYPVYVPDGESPREVASRNPERTMECYDLRKDREAQLAEPRANHWEA
jgi:hypothetical protein